MSSSATLFELSNQANKEQKKRQDIVDQLVRENQKRQGTINENEAQVASMRGMLEEARKDRKAAASELMHVLCDLSETSLRLDVVWQQYQLTKQHLKRLDKSNRAKKRRFVDEMFVTLKDLENLEDWAKQRVESHIGQTQLKALRDLKRTKEGLARALKRRQAKMDRILQKDAELTTQHHALDEESKRLQEEQQRLERQMDQCKIQKVSSAKQKKELERLQSMKRCLLTEIARMQKEKKEALIRKRISDAKSRVYNGHQDSSCSESESDDFV